MRATTSERGRQTAAPKACAHGHMHLALGCASFHGCPSHVRTNSKSKRLKPEQGTRQYPGALKTQAFAHRLEASPWTRCAVPLQLASPRALNEPILDAISIRNSRHQTIRDYLFHGAKTPPSSIRQRKRKPTRHHGYSSEPPQRSPQLRLCDRERNRM